VLARPTRPLRRGRKVRRVTTIAAMLKVAAASKES
jgi:hypothetical protein